MGQDAGARDHVRDVVVLARRVVDTVAPLRAGASLQAGELLEQPGVVGEFHQAAVDERCVRSPAYSASSALCGLRPGRNPYENPRKSVS